MNSSEMNRPVAHIEAMKAKLNSFTASLPAIDKDRPSTLMHEFATQPYDTEPSPNFPADAFQETLNRFPMLQNLATQFNTILGTDAIPLEVQVTYITLGKQLEAAGNQPIAGNPSQIVDVIRSGYVIELTKVGKNLSKAQENMITTGLQNALAPWFKR